MLREFSLFRSMAYFSGAKAYFPEQDGPVNPLRQFNVGSGTRRIATTDGAHRRAGEGRVPGSDERRGFESLVAGSAVGIGYPVATIAPAGAGRQPALSIPVRYPITPSYS
jgi:hypothetical protein